MAVEQKRIKERLKALFPKVNLSTKRLDAIAAKLSQKPEDEADDDAVDAVINDYNENGAVSFEDLARYDDKVRTLEIKAAKAKPAKVEPDEDEPEPSADPLKALLGEFKSLKEEITSLKNEKAQNSLSDRFKSDERLKGVPEFLIKRAVPKTEDEFDAAVEELVNDYKPFAEKNKLSAFGKDVPASGTGESTGKVKEASDAEIEELVNNLNI